MKEILVLGAGYAGLKAVRTLQKEAGDVHITLVDRNPYHYEATELHEVAAGSQPSRKISFPIQEVIDSQRVTFIQDQVLTIDCETQSVQLQTSGLLSYDYLVIALGFTSETFGIKGAMENALQMVDIETAEAIHQHILHQMAAYRETKDENHLRLLICGAGFTGIELAGAFVDERKRYADLAGVSPDKIEIICVEAATSILPMFDDDLRAYALQLIDKLGIRLMTGCMIKEITPGHVLYATAETGEELQAIAASTIIWTTGVSGSPVMAESGFDQRRGRVVVTNDLRSPDHDNVYIVGDVSAFMDPTTSRPYPTTAQIATQMGKHVAKNLQHQLKGEPLEEFVYQSQGTVASIGNTHALGLAFDKKVKGYPASVIKKAIMNKSLLDMGGLKELVAHGRFDLYH
ncbi:NAD(P)/FAD-dependent oxidoreductase [Streptococcus sp. zg-86]|uniref:NAD(P)/FAD-dependent oxidoreductase n=1 Tax=Streptococcus zhangguiae TaxID=2664091 RepID=A0A6I4RGJ7_9STRE|nr:MULTISPECIES: NAD(P)/FAD-dependent oxidoreductase [unclassified Streptococcus]MTB64009.1 NAD(P)/FAD-dependent oxidoreductase [Streptococcus sp. zg-86]MTB90319.1 NAD(P)/FAD-dependent oxidoreductase [Streptococcus sp. zg-36]MWV55997.1 NAD(P)/FAD-dependent oxidoreductase [Streptococcus sp. zg-70]QTH47035.1 NAD(P)/FAD-dependent oxidoreductase [Streptococcus sp. zg-86]